MGKKTIGTRVAVTLSIGLLGWAVSTPALSGQARRPMSVDAQGGVAIPTGRLNDLTNVGPSAAIQVNFPVMQRLAVFLSGEFDQLNGAQLTSIKAPDLRLWSYGVGVQVNLLPMSGRAMSAAGDDPPMSNKWALLADVGVGGTTYDSKPFLPAGSSTSQKFKQSYFQGNGGLTAQYAASSRVLVYVGAQGNLSFANTTDTAVLAALDSGGKARAFGTAFTVPVSAGITIHP